MTQQMNSTTKYNAAHMASMNAIQIARADKFALDLQGLIDLLRSDNLTHHAMAEAMNDMGYRTPRGHYWTYKSARNVCARLDAIRGTDGVAEAAQAAKFLDDCFARRMAYWPN
jgi:hypothetical protein